VRTILTQFLTRTLPAVPPVAYCWAHIDDVAEGHRLAMERGQIGRSYFLAGPPHTLVEALHIAESVTGIPAPRRRVPAAALKVASAGSRAVETVMRLPPSLASETLRVLAGVTYLGRNDRARTELGWSPRSLRDGLAETLRHEQQLLKM
jgi:nucleoside-diphosphate-sugar epimerase